MKHNVAQTLLPRSLLELRPLWTLAHARYQDVLSICQQRSSVDELFESVGSAVCPRVEKDGPSAPSELSAHGRAFGGGREHVHVRAIGDQGDLPRRRQSAPQEVLAKRRREHIDAVRSLASPTL